MSQTTATLQTPPGKGGIAVIALIGPEAERILDIVFRPGASHADAGADALQLGRLVDDGQVIDEAVVCRCDAGVEINIHGGPAAARATMKLLARHGAVAAPAEAAAPRSFPTAHPQWRNPAIGTEMIEALAHAHSLRVVEAIAAQWSGGLSARARSEPTAPDLRAAADGLAVMQKLLRPAEVVLAGPPNAGKSTLANALIGREISIVHRRAGTTRDWVRELALLEGLPVWLTDTAGIWDVPESNCPAAAVDAEAVRRARHRAEGADLVLLLAAGDPTDVPAWLHAKHVLRIATKTDAVPPDAAADVTVSAHTREGLDVLRAAILHALGLADFDPTAARAFTERQVGLLVDAADALDAEDALQAQRTLNVLLEGPARARA